MRNKKEKDGRRESNERKVPALPLFLLLRLLNSAFVLKPRLCVCLLHLRHAITLPPLQNSGHVSGGRGGEGSRHNGEDEEDAWGAQAEGAHLCTAVGRNLVGQGGEKHQNTYF